MAHLTESYNSTGWLDFSSGIDDGGRDSLDSSLEILAGTVSSDS